MSKTTFNGYDMTFMTAPEADKALIKEQLNRRKDEIDALIKANKLHTRKDMLGQILEELALHKFWKQLNERSGFHVFTFLAEDRMLNFYEAATSASFNIKDTRIGMITAALSACTRTDIELKRNPSALGPMPCFMNSVHADIPSFDIKCLDEYELLEVKDLLTSLYRRPTESSRMTDGNRLKIYLMDAFRMWIITQDKTLKDFMTDGTARSRFIPVQVNDSMQAAYELGRGRVSNYKALVELTCFNTVWGRAKSFNYNARSIVSSMI